MRINLTTSTLRAIYNLQKSDMDDHSIIRSVQVVQAKINAERALMRAEQAITKHFDCLAISTDDKVNIETLAL